MEQQLDVALSLVTQIHAVHTFLLQPQEGFAYVPQEPGEFAWAPVQRVQQQPPLCMTRLPVGFDQLDLRASQEQRQEQQLAEAVHRLVAVRCLRHLLRMSPPHSQRLP